jgi:hypothetical protein
VSTIESRGANWLTTAECHDRSAPMRHNVHPPLSRRARFEYRDARHCWCRVLVVFSPASLDVSSFNRSRSLRTSACGGGARGRRRSTFRGRSKAARRAPHHTVLDAGACDCSSEGGAASAIQDLAIAAGRRHGTDPTLPAGSSSSGALIARDGGQSTGSRNGLTRFPWSSHVTSISPAISICG